MPWNPEHYNMKKENPIAKELRTPKYRKRVVEDKTVYNRKKIRSDEEDDNEGDRMRFGDHLYEVAEVEKLNGSLNQDFIPDNKIKVDTEDEEAKKIGEMAIAPFLRKIKK